jgi:malonate transporter and related proteins
MQAIFNVVLPVFGLIFAGMAAGRFRLLGQDSSEALNRFVYYFALPAVLFLGMARVPVEKSANLPFIAAYFGGTVASFVVVGLVARIAFPGRVAEYALGAMSGTFSNTGYMGIPLFMTAFGAGGLLPVFISTVLNTAVMVGVVVTIIELEQHRDAGAAHALGKVLWALATNPLVVSCALGILYSAAGLTLPIPVATFGDLLGAAAGPCALFAIGLFLATRSLKTLMGGRKAIEVSWLVVMKLVLQPALTWALGLYVGLPAFWLASAVILAALPTGALTFVLATNYGTYIERTSAVILASTVVSVVTLSAVMVAFAGAHP